MSSKFFYFEISPRSGENLLGIPAQLRVPLVRTRRGNYLIPRHPAIARLSFWTAEPGKYWRDEARRLGEYLSEAGYPAFDQNGHLRIYCLRVDAQDILDVVVTLGLAAGWGRISLPVPDPAGLEAINNALQAGGKYWEWLEGWLVTQPPLPWHVEGMVLTVGERKYPLPDGAELVAPATNHS
jgi:hypothetical protein